MTISDKLLDPKFWGSFKIPGFAFGVISLFLLMRNVNAPLEFVYIKNLANFAVGASIISYGHSLIYSTWMNLEKGKDLPLWVQISAIIIYAFWFGFIFWKLLRPCP
jgi:hypothetical protein